MSAIKDQWQSPDRSIRLLLGDCLQILPELEAGSVDAVVTDPPYGTEALGGGYGRHKLSTASGQNARKIKNDIDLSVLLGVAKWAAGAIDDGWLIAFCGARKRHEAAALLALENWEPFGEYVWDKGRPGLGYTIRYSHETALVHRRGKPERQKALLSLKRHFVAGTPARPHEKPLEVVLPLVLFAAPPGGLIVDPCMGCGPVGVACTQLKRRFVGIELDEEYYRNAVSRCRAELDRMPLFEPRPVQKTLL